MISRTNMIQKTNIKLQALLLTAALLAAVLAILQVLNYRAVGCCHSKAPKCAARSAVQHWRRVWTCPAGASLSGAPAVWSNGWVAATGTGSILALDNSGRVLWNRAFSNLVFAGSPAVAGDAVVAVTGDGNVVAVEAATGKSLWQVKVEGAYRHGPLPILRGEAWQVVLLSSADGVLRCLDGKNGQELWRSEPTNRSDGAPGCDGQWLAYGNCDAAVHIFSATNGGHLARIPVGDDAQMAGGVLVRDGRVFGGTRNGDLVCAAVAATNEVAWRARMADGEAFCTPVAARGLVIMGAPDGSVAAFDAHSGSVRWRLSLRSAIFSLCVVDDAVFTVAGGSLVGLRAKDGGTFLTLSVGDDVEGPAWNGRTLVVAADGGNVIGFKGE